MVNERLVGLGYALPWLDRFGSDADRAIAFMPSAQGAIATTGASNVAMGDETHLPFPDALFDRVLKRQMGKSVHGLWAA